MWIINNKEQMVIEKVKASRPGCLKRFVKHTFAEFFSENKRSCVDCGYTEKQVIKE